MDVNYRKFMSIATVLCFLNHPAHDCCLGLVVKGNNGELTTLCPEMINASSNDLIARGLFILVFCTAVWKKSHRLSERLASLGIVQAQLKAPLKLLNAIVL